MWTKRKQLKECIQAMPVLGVWRSIYHCYFYRWHAKLAHKFGKHTYQKLGVKGATKESGLAPYFERCTWCGHVKEFK